MPPANMLETSFVILKCLKSDYLTVVFSPSIFIILVLIIIILLFIVMLISY